MTSNKSVLEQNTSGIPKFVPLLIGLLVVSLISLILLARMTPRSTQMGSFDFVQATQAFTPGQAMTITAGNITVYAPKDSVNLPGTISVISQEANHDVKLQNDQIDNMVSQGVKGLIVVAEDGDAVVTSF